MSENSLNLHENRILAAMFLTGSWKAQRFLKEAKLIAWEKCRNFLLELPESWALELSLGVIKGNSSDFMCG